MGEIITSLKEFVWDIIGYLIPGFLLMIILNFFLISSVGVSDDFLIDWKVFNPTYVIIVIAYVLGFVVYSITLFKIYIQNILIDSLKNIKLYKYFKKYHSKFWEEDFKISETFSAAQQKLEDDGIDNAKSMKVNEVRNIFMSRNPEMDQKVYTFMFRASVFDHTSTIMILILFMAVLHCLTSFLGVFFMKMETLHVVLYFCFALLCVRLGNAKRMFYSVSQRIPFSNLK